MLRKDALAERLTLHKLHGFNPAEPAGRKRKPADPAEGVNHAQGHGRSTACRSRFLALLAAVCSRCHSRPALVLRQQRWHRGVWAPMARREQLQTATRRAGGASATEVLSGAGFPLLHVVLNQPQKA